MTFSIASTRSCPLEPHSTVTTPAIYRRRCGSRPCAAGSASDRAIRRRLIVVGDHVVPIGVGALRRRIRLLTCGRCSWSIPHGGTPSGNQPALIRQDRPFCKKWVWSAQQGQVANIVLAERPDSIQLDPG